MTRNMQVLGRWGLWTSLVLLIAVGGATAGERIVVESILARVNDRILTVSDFRERLNAEVSQAAVRPEGEELKNYASHLFDSIVEEMVLLERAQEKQMTIGEDVLDRAINSLREENNLVDDEAFDLAMEETGMTEEGLRERYRQSMLVQRAVQAEVQPSEITEEEVRLIYEAEKERFKVPKKIELEQMFFPSASNSAENSDLLRRVEALIKRVTEGSDLIAEATLAGVEVADIGAIPEEDLRPELRQVLDGLEEGQLSAPLSTAGGFQVVRLVRRIPAGYEPFDEVKENLRRRESMEAYQQQSRGLVAKLKIDYLVEVHRERLALVFGE